MSAAAHFQRPGWFTTHVLNGIVAGLARVGISVAGSRVLEVPGRASGTARRTPVNLLIVDGQRYLVAPRGHTQWVRNLRASGRGRLLLGRHREPFAAAELSDAEKTPILRAYLKRWKFEVGMFFDGVGPDVPGGGVPPDRTGSPGLPDHTWLTGARESLVTVHGNHLTTVDAPGRPPWAPSTLVSRWIRRTPI